MGVVYKAEDTKLKRIVALKFLPTELTRDEVAKKRLLHEAQAISALQHHNICTIHEVDETDDGHAFFCMDYYGGESLKTRLAHGPLSVEEAIDITLQVARGLESAHRRGVVHRDIKPANVIVTPDGVAKILDFGLSKLTGQSKLTKTGSTLGTVAYMSPEQVRGEELDARSDIFSLGVTLYELLTGTTPFAADYEQAIQHKILHVAPPPLRNSGVEHAAELDPVLGKMLAKDRTDRSASAGEVIRALSAVQPEARRGVGRSESRRRRAIVTIAGVALVIVGALATLRIWQKSNPPLDELRAARTAVAVLPFQNLSVDRSRDYFASGLHDEILTQLSKVAALQVISRTSVMGYAGSGTPVRQIASELKVGSVVEGSVQVVGERLRVNVQLIDAATDQHLWAERYDRTLDDAFAIQSDVAQRIVEAIGATLQTAEHDRISHPPTANAEAYQFYLQARDYANRPSLPRSDLESAERLYERALALDPDFALAHAELSLAHGFLHWFRFDVSPARVVRQREEAEAALRLAPDLPEAHVAMGAAHYFGRLDYRAALAEFEIALRGLPNDAQVVAWVGYINRRLGNWDKVDEAYHRATRLSPRDANLPYDLGGCTLMSRGRFSDAVREFDLALALAPDLNAAAVWKGWTFVRWRGEVDTLRSVLNRLPVDAPIDAIGNTPFHNATLLLWERRTDELLEVLATAPGLVLESQEFYRPKSLYAAWAHRLSGSGSSAREEFQAAVTLLDSVIVILPDDERVHRARGLALAGLGRHDDALDEARWLAQSIPYREDMLDGPFLHEERARILAQAGEADEALDEIEPILAAHGFLTVHVLRLDPLWDPIREHPRFKALVAKYGEP